MIIQNLRYAARSLAQRPVFTLVAVSSLALGIGLNTTIFTAVNAILLKRLPIAEPERLVEIYTSAVEEMPYLTVSYPDYRDLREQCDAFEELAAHAMVRGILYREGHGELILGEVVSDNYFETLGVKPAVGREFGPDEDEIEGRYPVAVVSHGLWQRRLGGDPNVVGQRLRLNGIDFEIVGVAPSGFTGSIPGLTPEFWAPTAMVENLRFSGIQFETKSPTGNTRRERRGSRWLFVKGRLRPGVGIEQATTQVETVLGRLESEHPIANEKLKGVVVPASSVRFHPMVDGMLTGASAVLLVAVGLVLLIACANVANMLLARGQGRSREFAVRLSVGASRWQIVSQLMVESMVLAALAAAVGIGLAFGASRMLAAIQPTLPVPVSFAYELDLAVLTYAVLLSLLTAVVFGLVPALRASRPNLVPALKTDTGAAEKRGGRGVTMSKVLVVGQLAVSLVLLVAGTLLTRGLIEAQRADLGFDPSRVASISFDLGMNNYSREQVVAFQREIIDRIRALPGVEAVSLGTRFPLSPDVKMEGVLIPEHHQAGDDGTPIDATDVDPEYFRVFDLPILQGRNFSTADREETTPVVIINEAMAERYWPEQEPVGKRIYTEGFDEPPHEVIGVVRNHKVRSIGEGPTPYLYFSITQSPRMLTSLFVRAKGTASAILPELRREVLTMNPAIVLMDESTATEVVDLTLMPTRVGAVLLGGFGLMALGLAAIGLYGVIAYTVSRRTREVGLRMALGARVSDVVGMILRQGLVLALWGIGVGFGVSIWVGGFLRSLLYGVSRVDPLAFAGAGLVLLAVAAIANFVPALRAARVSPISALRYE